MWIAPEYVDTHDDRFSQTGLRAVIWADLFSVTSEVEFPDNTNSFLSQMLHNPLLTLLFVRLFPTSCFDNDFAVESLPRLFSTFEAPCFAVFPVGLKNDRMSCRKYVIIIKTSVKTLSLRTKTTNKPFYYGDLFTSLSDISRHLWNSPVLQSAVTNLASFQTAISLPLIFRERRRS